MTTPSPQPSLTSLPRLEDLPQTGWRGKVMRRWRRRCSIVNSRISKSGYTPDEIAAARKFVANPDWGKMLLDVQASIDELKKSGPVAIMGFCMGGTISFLAACKLNGLSAAVCYYGGQIAKNVDQKPKVPVQMHFGEKDASIPMSDVDLIKQKRGGDCEIYVYPDAQHGFHCDERGSYQEAAAKLAWQRSMAFLAKNVK